MTTQQSSTEQAVGLLMDGLLLSYFRSTHEHRGSLHVVREYRLKLPNGDNLVADFAVVDAESGAVVAVFEIASTSSALKSARRVLAVLRTAFSDASSKPLLGLVVPERLADGKVLSNSEKAGVEVVTYAA